MPHIVITQQDGQIRIEAEIAPEPALLLLAQAIEILRVQVVAKAVADLPPKVAIATTLPSHPNGMEPGRHGITGGDVTFRLGRVDDGR